MIVGAFATSHAYTFQEPETRDQRRTRSKANVAKKAGPLADDTPQAKAETLEDNREPLAALQADAVLLIGDDQTENLGAENTPQFLIYTGQHTATIRNDSEIARTLVEGVLDEGFDVSWATKWKDGKLLSDAHTEPILYLVRDTTPVIPLFVNAVHPSTPSPARCYEFGRALGRVIDASLKDKRLVLCASGGLSHFSPSHPWAHHVGARYVGDISVEFDRRLVAWMRAGEGHRLAEFSSRELIEHGEAELRQWIVLLGAIGSRRPEFIVYEPLFRSIMGMGVAWW